MTHKQVIVVRKDLKMRTGKAVAQGAHASTGALLSLATYQDNLLTIPLDERLGPWLAGSFTKICVSVNSEAELLALHEQAQKLGLVNCLIQDNGLTEFHGVKTYTCLAVGPDLAEKVDQVTQNLPLL